MGSNAQLPYVLDWGATRQRMYATVYGTHHGVKALREISKILKKSP